ncbi:MAG: cytochrome C [Bacteroidetes bacterium]|nr:cytochrome C [Bacteroidota bacterium]
MKKTLAFLPLLLLLAAFTPASKPADPEIPADVKPLLEKYGCVACHALNRKLVGPMWTDVGAKKYSAKRIMQLVAKPEPANWPGYPPMAAQKVPKADLTKIANWLSSMK